MILNFLARLSICLPARVSSIVIMSRPDVEKRLLPLAIITSLPLVPVLARTYQSITTLPAVSALKENV